MSTYKSYCHEVLRNYPSYFILGLLLMLGKCYCDMIKRKVSVFLIT